MPTLKAVVETITPTTAATWLRANTRNRPINQNHVARLSSMMAAGRWRLTGEAIVFSASGVLMDGQHRLHACIASGATIQSMVVRGTDEDAVNFIDATRQPRQGKDALALAGYSDGKGLSGAVRAVALHRVAEQRGTPPQSSKVFMDNDEIVQAAAQEQGLAEWARRVQGRPACTVLQPRARMAACFYLLEERGGDLAHQFFRAIVDGVGLDRGDPRLTVRNAMIMEVTKAAKHSPEWRIAVIVKAWNAWLRGQAMKICRWKAADEAWPVIERPRS